MSDEQTCRTCSAPCCRGRVTWDVPIEAMERAGVQPGVNVFDLTEEQARICLAYATEHWLEEQDNYGACQFLREPGTCSRYRKRPGLCRVWDCKGERWAPQGVKA